MKKDVQAVIDAFIFAHNLEGIKGYSSSFYKKESSKGFDTWILKKINKKPWIIDLSLTIILDCENRIFIKFDTDRGHFKNYNMLQIEDLFDFEIFENEFEPLIFVNSETLMDALLILTR